MQLTLSYMYMFTHIAVGVADIAAREFSPHNVLHLSSCVHCMWAESVLI